MSLSITWHFQIWIQDPVIYSIIRASRNRRFTWDWWFFPISTEESWIAVFVWKWLTHAAPVQWMLVPISLAFDKRHTISKLWFQICTGDCDSYSTFWQQGKFEFLKSVYLCTSKHYSKEHFIHLQQFHKAHGEVTIQQHSSTAFQKVLLFWKREKKEIKKKQHSTGCQNQHA